MNDTKSQADVLIAQHRRARSAQQLGASTMADWEHDATFQRLREKVSAAESLGHGYLAASGTSPETILADLEKNEKIERLLNDLKTKAIESAK